MRELKPWMVMSMVRKYVGDLIEKKHFKYMALDKDELEKCEELLEEKDLRSRNTKLKKIDFRKPRACFGAK